MNDKKKNVVVIGSGIGGSGIAAMLAHRGFSVTVLEKLNIIGGRCCSREKNGFILDLGVHTFSQAGAGPLGEILRKCGLDDSRLIEWSYTKNPTQKLSYMGSIVDFPKNIGRIGADIDQYMNIVNTIVKMPLDEIKNVYHISLKEWLDRYTTNRPIHNIFGYIAELYFVIPYWRASAGEFIRSMQEQARKRASGYPVGGCRVIPENYLKVVTDNGGKVRTNSAVKRIIITDGKAAGVELKSGEVLNADIVISNADPGITVKLAGENNFPAEYIKKVKNIEYSPGACILKFALKRKITDEKFIMHIGNEDSDGYLKKIEDGKIPDKVNLMIPVISNLDPSTAPEGHQLIIAGSFPAIAPDWDSWQNSVMGSVRDIFPDIEEHVLFIETTTPGEVDKMAGEGGGVIGMAQTTEQVGTKRMGQKTPVQDLYIVGGEAGGWGIGTELAATSAMELNEII